MPVSINQALSAFGLSEKEQRIYLAALELGSATAGRITEKADINRSTVYDLLRMLIEKGICSTVIKGGKKFFEIVPPRGLVAMIEEKKQKLLAVQQELERLHETAIVKPAVEMYEGKQGIEAALEGLLEDNGEILVYGPSLIFDTLSFILPRYIQKRIEKRIMTRVIQEPSKTSTALQKIPHTLREVRTIQKYHPTAAVFLSKNRMVTVRVSEREPIAVVVIDKDIAQSQREFFEKVWAIAKR